MVDILLAIACIMIMLLTFVILFVPLMILVFKYANWLADKAKL